MSSFQGIKDATKDILEKKKIEKIKFGEVMPPQEEVNNEEILIVKTLKHENDKTIKSKTAKTANTHILKNAERRKADKHQITAYLLDSELDMLEELYFIRRKKKMKIDKSSLIGEAIGLLYKKTV